MNHISTTDGAQTPRSKTPYSPPKPGAGVTTNPEQAVYVIPCGDGYSCLGFENARAHAAQISQALGRPELALTDVEFGQVSGYGKYLKACAAWGDSRQARTTYFDPGTPEAVCTVLERYRKSGRTLRVVLGDPDTGRDWHEEHDVVGRVGRSSGSLKIPLLVSGDESCGPALLTRCIVRLIDWETQRELYVHPNYAPPAMAIVPCEDARNPWEVTIDGQTHGRFSDIGKAGAYVGFMRGLSINPRCFQ